MTRDPLRNPCVKKKNVTARSARCAHNTPILSREEPVQQQKRKRRKLEIRTLNKKHTRRRQGFRATKEHMLLPFQAFRAKRRFSSEENGPQTLTCGAARIRAQ
jgi:hypothetical protein